MTIAPCVDRAHHPPEDRRAADAASSCPRSRSSTSRQLRRDYEKLRLAHELGRAIVVVLDLEQLLEQIIMKAFELIPADRGVILL